MQDVLAWLDGGDEPRTVRDASFAPTPSVTLQTRLSAAYRGDMALLMQAGGKDFLSGDPIALTTYFDTAVNIHHIFPRTYCERQEYDRQLEQHRIKQGSAFGSHEPYHWRQGPE